MNEQIQKPIYEEYSAQGLEQLRSTNLIQLKIGGDATQMVDRPVPKEKVKLYYDIIKSNEELVKKGETPKSLYDESDFGSLRKRERNEVIKKLHKMRQAESKTNIDRLETGFDYCSQNNDDKISFCSTVMDNQSQFQSNFNSKPNIMLNSRSSKNFCDKDNGNKYDSIDDNTLAVPDNSMFKNNQKFNSSRDRISKSYVVNVISDTSKGCDILGQNNAMLKFKRASFLKKSTMDLDQMQVMNNTNKSENRQSFSRKSFARAKTKQERINESDLLPNEQELLAKQQSKNSLTSSSENSENEEDKLPSLNKKLYTQQNLPDGLGNNQPEDPDDDSSADSIVLTSQKSSESLTLKKSIEGKSPKKQQSSCSQGLTPIDTYSLQAHSYDKILTNNISNTQNDTGHAIKINRGYNSKLLKTKLSQIVDEEDDLSFDKNSGSSSDYNKGSDSFNITLQKACLDSDKIPVEQIDSEKAISLPKANGNQQKKSSFRRLANAEQFQQIYQKKFQDKSIVQLDVASPLRKCYSLKALHRMTKDINQSSMAISMVGDETPTNPTKRKNSEPIQLKDNKSSIIISNAQNIFNNDSQSFLKDFQWNKPKKTTKSVRLNMISPSPSLPNLDLKKSPTRQNEISMLNTDSTNKVEDIINQTMQVIHLY